MDGWCSAESLLLIVARIHLPRFVYRHMEHYDAIFWFQASTETKLIELLYTHIRVFELETDALPLQNVNLFEIFHKRLVTATKTGMYQSDGHVLINSFSMSSDAFTVSFL